MSLFLPDFLCDNEPSMKHHACMKCFIFGDCRTPKGECLEVDNSVVAEQERESPLLLDFSWYFYWTLHCVVYESEASFMQILMII